MMGLKNVQGYYDKNYAEVYDKYINDIPIYQRYINNAIDDLDPEENESYLVVGCGTGNEIIELSRRVSNVEITGMDISKEILKRAERNLEEKVSNLELSLMDAEEMEFQDESFENVIALHVLGHLQNPKKGSKEILRVLEGGGEFVVTYPIDASIIKVFMGSLGDIKGLLNEGKVQELYKNLKASLKVSKSSKSLSKIRSKNSNHVEKILDVFQDKSSSLDKRLGYAKQDLVISGVKKG